MEVVEAQYEVALLMAPKPITLWAWALLFHGEWFKVVESWRLGGIYRCCFLGGGVGFSTLCHYLSIVTICNTHNKCLMAQALDIGDLLQASYIL